MTETGQSRTAGRLSPRYAKVLRDVTTQKPRSVLVVLSIAVGVFAVGMIAGTRIMLLTGLTDSYQAINPPSATLYTGETFQADLVDMVAAMPGVAEADGRRRVTVRYLDAGDTWRDLSLTAIPDFDRQRVRIVSSDSGPFPPPRRAMLVERSAVPILGRAIGDYVEVKAPSGQARRIRLVGVAHDVSREPAFIEGVPYGYITFDTLEWLGQPRSMNELDIVVAGPAATKAEVQRVTQSVRNKIESGGRSVRFTFISEPGKHPLDTIVSTVMLLLGSLGGLALLLSGALVVNTISAVLAQQGRQIGIMKTIGATEGQIVRLYFLLVLTYGVLALVIAVPLGLAGAFGLTAYLGGLLNIDPPPMRIPWEVVALQVTVGLIVPMAAASVPVVSGARITVREALASYGLGKGHFGLDRLDKWLQRLKGFSRPVLLSLRNTFRRKARLALTLGTLTLGGAIFVAVFSVKASLSGTLGDILGIWRYDFMVALARPYRSERLVDAALSLPGIRLAEAWGFSGTRIARADGTEGEALMLFAAPADTELLNPEIVAGRWLLPEDEGAVVVNTQVFNKEPELKVGDAITLKLDGRDTAWTVVGAMRAPGPEAYMIATYDHFAEVTRSVGRATSLLVVADTDTRAGRDAAAGALEAHLREAGLRVLSMIRIEHEMEEAEAAFNILVVLLLVMATLLSVVGALGLAGTMGLNVIERTREIGVMRAIGASHASVATIVVVEGLVIGLLSWALGAVVAHPLGVALSSAVGTTFLEAPMRFIYSYAGLAGWFLVVAVLAVVSSLLPAWNATRVSVREVLAYE